jgi:hypothetical protein
MLVMRVFAGNQETSQKAPLRSKIVERSTILKTVCVFAMCWHLFTRKPLDIVDRSTILDFTLHLCWHLLTRKPLNMRRASRDSEQTLCTMYTRLLAC